jgi:hypothetical protein
MEWKSDNGAMDVYMSAVIQTVTYHGLMIAKRGLDKSTVD